MLDFVLLLDSGPIAVPTMLGAEVHGLAVHGLPQGKLGVHVRAPAGSPATPPRYAEPLPESTRPLALEPDKPQALYNLAMARLRKQDRGGARQAYEQLRRSHPDFPGLPQLAQLLDEGRAR